MSKAMLTICGCQYHSDAEPEIIELTTEGTLTRSETGWEIAYEESDMTGMEGVKTTFCIEPGLVRLRRTGKLRSEMEFREGVPHESLYQLDFGALLITVCARQISASIGPGGGRVDLTYDIEIEQAGNGIEEYHLDVRVIE
jgi:uncharacterized beta-barrel protein YwiB (DUF1934 family)